MHGWGRCHWSQFWQRAQNCVKSQPAIYSSVATVKASHLVERVFVADAHRTEVVGMAVVLAEVAQLKNHRARLRKVAVSTVVAEIRHPERSRQSFLKGYG